MRAIWMLVALVLSWVLQPQSAFAETKEVLRVDTRFGPVTVVRTNDCCDGYIQFRDQKIALTSAGEIYATREALFQTTEGDLVVVSIPSGARGMPPGYYPLLVSAAKLTDIADKNFTSGDGTFSARQRGNEIEFDLGFENRKRKMAFYRGGVIYIGSNLSRPQTSLSREDCAYVLNTLADCRKSCPADGFMSMSVQRSFNSLEQKPVFQSENFFRICEQSCKGKPFSTPVARQELCGY